MAGPRARGRVSNSMPSARVRIYWGQPGGPAPSTCRQRVALVGTSVRSCRRQLPSPSIVDRRERAPGRAPPVGLGRSLDAGSREHIESVAGPAHAGIGLAPGPSGSRPGRPDRVPPDRSLVSAGRRLAWPEAIWHAFACIAAQAIDPQNQDDECCSGLLTDSNASIMLRGLLKNFYMLSRSGTGFWVSELSINSVPAVSGVRGYAVDSGDPAGAA